MRIAGPTTGRRDASKERPGKPPDLQWAGESLPSSPVRRPLARRCHGGRRRARSEPPSRTSTSPPRHPKNPTGCAPRRSHSEDPAAAAAPVDAAALEERRRERAAQIVRALNPEQARAVTTTEGPLLILAGAGSGKTRVLAHRIAYLVGVKDVAPWRILAVTFTNRAAAELRERIISLVGERGRDVVAGTFHALCARVLRADGEAIGIGRRFVIYDTDDQTSLMKQILREEDMPLTGEFRPSIVLGAISRAKNEMLDPTFLSENAVNHRERTIARLATRYQARLRKANALDFDDLLLEAVRLFEEAPEVLAKYQDRWRYLHIDEYQDTNRAQYLWIRALAATHHNLCVVGDDDQSIYSWRGADLRNILDFERDWPTTAVVKLEQNYRSTQLILDAAHSVVSRNVARKDKKLWTENAGGIKIQRFEAYNEEEEAEWIARQVEGLVGGRSTALTRRADAEEEPRFRARDIAVMYRMNAQSRAIEESFLRYGHPLPARRWHPVLQPARGQGRARVPAGAPVGHGQRQLRADHQRAGSGDRRQDDRNASRRGRARRRNDVGRDRGGCRVASSRRSLPGPGTHSPISRCLSGGCGRGSGSCHSPSSSTTSSRPRATARCSPTAPTTATNAGRTCSSCVR